MTDPRDTMRWVRRAIAIAALGLGWLFIGWQNHFHFTAPVVFICLGYLAVVATIYNLWRTGAAAVDTGEDEGDSTWAQPVGRLGELEREKRTLLKAIKEAEFDHQMGKLSQRDADDMIRGYRTRAIDVIKDIERLEVGAAGTVREQILREVRARVVLESKAPKAAARGDARPGGKRGRGKRPADAATLSAAAKGIPEAGRKDAAPADAADTGEARDAKAKATARAAADAPAEPTAAAGAHGGAPPEAHSEEPAAPESPKVVRPRDEELDADSTTALEPRGDESAKEATR
jgi:hypothetical protein